jgi:hypothetical protein
MTLRRVVAQNSSSPAMGLLVLVLGPPLLPGEPGRLVARWPEHHVVRHQGWALTLGPGVSASIRVWAACALLLAAAALM